MSSTCSPESAASVSDSSEPACEPSPSARSTPTAAPCSASTGRPRPAIPTCASSIGFDCDLICGGFPCQDISSAGRRAGLEGAKSGLFSELIRLVGSCRPAWVLVENSARGARHWVEEARSRLAALGYESLPFQAAASDIGANHERNRGFVLAHAGSGRCALAAEALRARGQGSELHPWWANEPGIPRVDDGLPNRVDRRRVLGNTVVPQIVEAIGRAIIESESRP